MEDTTSDAANKCARAFALGSSAHLYYFALPRINRSGSHDLVDHLGPIVDSFLDV
jgi:hypothetical protein